MMIDWVPVVFVAFKALIFGACMFFAIKWHYDQDKKDRRAVLRAGGIAAAVCVAVFIALALVTFVLTKSMGLDLSMP